LSKQTKDTEKITNILPNYKIKTYISLSTSTNTNHQQNPTVTTTPTPPSQAKPSQARKMTAHTAFFYGTLMAPQVLHRVCHGSTSPSNPIYATHNFKITPAILPGHRRHRVKNADYPAVLPNSESTVRGTCVSGLTDADVWRLDLFEGDEYKRVKVRCRLLVDGKDEGGEEVEVETYVWTAGEERLEAKEWDFEEFRREKLKFWAEEEGQGEFAGE
jgi:gamma-glutamylcyclotransferase (GGCT)/AIG2-like uncharacterized protein YtfP